MYGVKGSFLSRLMMIKDGEIARTFDLIPEQIYGNSVNNAVYSRGELYINCGSGLKKVNMQTAVSLSVPVGKGKGTVLGQRSGFNIVYLWYAVLLILYPVPDKP